MKKQSRFTTENTENTEKNNHFFMLRNLSVTSVNSVVEKVFSMKTNRTVQIGLVMVCLLAALVVAQQALAGPSAAPVAQPSPIHPQFALLDADGEQAQVSGKPLSTIKTCGQCHDTAFIQSHSFHADLGLSEVGAPGSAGTGNAWDTSKGLFGKWDPLTNRMVSPAGDERPDLNAVTWLQQYAARVAGGGPALLADGGGMEMDCFLCHTPTPNTAERTKYIQAGKFDQANTVTLMGGIVTASGESWAYDANAFEADGKLKAERVQIQDPTNDNCGQCHGVVHTDSKAPLTLNACDASKIETATTGQVIAAQRINLSGLNLEGKAALSRSWDVHAERGLKCTDCHYSLNNPAHAMDQAGENPSHLTYDPRRLEIGEYLQRPDHNLARGQSAQYAIDEDTRGQMRRCESCHDAVKTHSTWLPYAERHMAEIACESCHIPKMYAPAYESVDWTVIGLDGQAVTECRGINGQSTTTDLVTGFKPVLMQRTNVDGTKKLAPYNLVSSWMWVYDSAGGPRPVRNEDLQAAFLTNGGYAPEIVAALDNDKNGTLEAGELRLDSDAKVQAVAKRLESLGLKNPHIEGQVQPYSINHSVARGDDVSRNCRDCHNSESRITAPLSLSGYLPGGVMPAFVSGNVAPSGELKNDGGKLVYQPVTSEDGVYVFGHNRVAWVDGLGALAFVGVLLGVAGHGTLRYVSSLRRPKKALKTKAVYMYERYERLWHWLQTFAIVLLLFTGLVIHRPDLFGAFSFPYMVTIHNVLAAILVINAFLSLFWHVAGGQIRQFIPRPYGFFDDAIVQARFYLQGIFKGGEHPFEKTRDKKLNPLQQVTYFGLLNVLLPLQIITGALMWGVQRWPEAANLLGGLPFLAPFHSLVAWLFGTFIVAHVYLTTTGATVFEDIKAMITGWENVEVHGSEEADSGEEVSDQDVNALPSEGQAAGG